MLDIDYKAVFNAHPVPMSLLSPEFRIEDANKAWLDAVGMSRDEVVGRDFFEVLPNAACEPPDEGPPRLRESLEWVLATGETDRVPLIRYDLPVPGKPGQFTERYWAVINSPVCGPDGEVILIVNRAAEATHEVKNVLAEQAVSG